MMLVSLFSSFPLHSCLIPPCPWMRSLSINHTLPPAFSVFIRLLPSCGALRSTGTSTSISSETTDGASKHLSFQTLLLSATGSFRTTTSSIDDVINRPRVRISYIHLLWSWINFALLTHLCQSLLVRYVTFTFLSKSLFSS